MGRKGLGFLEARLINVAEGRRDTDAEKILLIWRHVGIVFFHNHAGCSAHPAAVFFVGGMLYVHDSDKVLSFLVLRFYNEQFSHLQVFFKINPESCFHYVSSDYSSDPHIYTLYAKFYLNYFNSAGNIG